MIRRSATLPLAALLIAPLAHAGPTADELSADWSRFSDARGAYASIHFQFTADEFEDLSEGEVVRRLIDSGGGLAAVGVAWMPADPLEVWVAIQDVEDRPINKEQATITRLADDTPARRLSHNLVHAPWPITDRQSVFSATANASLWAATDQQVWERTVALEDPSLAPGADPEAVWLQHLGGGFLVTGCAGGSLVIMQLEADPGGNIPADLVARFGYVGLGRSMERLAAYAAEVPAHFGAGHDPVALPDGRLIQPGALRP